VWLTTLNASQRNCAPARSLIRNRLLAERLMVIKPGPSKMFRPELPKRKAVSGTTGNALTSKQRSGDGFGTVPVAMRSGRVGSPRSVLPADVCGVKGAGRCKHAGTGKLPSAGQPVMARRHYTHSDLERRRAAVESIANRLTDEATGTINLGFDTKCH
jgi:hypothetical protein